MDKMKVLWSTVRNVVVAAGAFVVGMSYADADTVNGIVQNLDAVIAGVASAGTALYGIYLRFRGR